MGPFHRETSQPPVGFDPRTAHLAYPPRPPHGPPHGPPYAQHASPPRANEGKAVASLVLGLASLLCFGAFTGLPAIILGGLARRDIDRSRGVLGGTGLAAAGIVSGLFGTGVSLVLAMFLLSGAVHLAGPDAPTETPVRVPVAAGTRSYGSLDVVDIDEERPLAEQLAQLSRSSAKSGRTVVLQTYVRSCRECAEIAAALPDRRMQRALAEVTLVRVDVETFEDDLKAMRVDTETVPWFYKLDGRAHPTDAVSADEWDENVPENMAPVLGPFVKGTLGARRTPSSSLGISL